MQRLFILLVCSGLMVAGWSQPNITRVEYFIDTDPGFGNGTAINGLATSSNIQNFSAGINISSVSNGIHFFYLRSRDANNKWSITNFQAFAKLSATAGVPNITRVEYFIDNDPGFGNGTAIANIPASNNVSSFSAPVNLRSVSTGIHFFFIRNRDANNKWSITNFLAFAKLSATPGQPNISEVEYFFDNDPGFGNATKIPIAQGTDVQNLSAAINISGLSLGFHIMYLRSKDANGKWSVTNMMPFAKANINNQPVTYAEYFIDTDPGHGNAVPVAMNSTLLSGDLPIQVNTTGLSVGTHRLYLRTRDQVGKWSITNLGAFQVTSQTATPFINVNAITKKVMCGDTEFLLSFHSTGTYNPGNTFSVQLSNASGSFASPTVIGSISATQSSIIPCTVPLNVANGNGYKVRVVSSNPVVTGVAADTLFNLFRQPRYPDSTVLIVCADETVNLTNLFNTAGFTTVWSTGNPGAAPAGNYTLISSNTPLCKHTAAIEVKQEVATWLGTTSNNWYLPANWSTGKVPGEKTHVIIPSGTPNGCVINGGTANAASIQVATTAVFNAINNGVLMILANCDPLPTNNP